MGLDLNSDEIDTQYKMDVLEFRQPQYAPSVDVPEKSFPFLRRSSVIIIKFISMTMSF